MCVCAYFQWSSACGICGGAFGTAIKTCALATSKWQVPKAAWHALTTCGDARNAAVICFRSGGGTSCCHALEMPNALAILS